MLSANSSALNPLSAFLPFNMSVCARIAANEPPSLHNSGPPLKCGGSARFIAFPGDLPPVFPFKNRCSGDTWTFFYCLGNPLSFPEQRCLKHSCFQTGSNRTLIPSCFYCLLLVVESSTHTFSPQRIRGTKWRPTEISHYSTPATSALLPFREF